MYKGDLVGRRAVGITGHHTWENQSADLFAKLVIAMKRQSTDSYKRPYISAASPTVKAPLMTILWTDPLARLSWAFVKFNAAACRQRQEAKVHVCCRRRGRERVCDLPKEPAGNMVPTARVQLRRRRGEALHAAGVF